MRGWGAAFILFMWAALPYGNQAANLVWNAPDGGAWSASANWTPTDVPDSPDDTLRFLAVNPGSVTTNDIPALLLTSVTLVKSTNVMDFSGNTVTCRTFSVTGNGASAAALTNAILTITNGGRLVVTGTLAVATGLFASARFTLASNVALAVGLATNSRAFLDIGENLAPYGGTAPNTATLTAGSAFSAYLSNLYVGRRLNGYTAGFTYASLDLSPVTTPGCLDVAGDVEIGVGENAAGVVTVPDSLNLKIGSPDSRGKLKLALTSKISGIQQSRLTLGTGRFDAYLSELSMVNAALCDGLLNASNCAAGILDVSGLVSIGDFSGNSYPRASVILGNGMEMKVGKAEGPRGNIVLGRTQQTLDSELVLGSGRFTAYLTNLWVGFTYSSAYTKNNKRMSCGSVSTGLLDVCGSLIVGQGYNAGSSTLLLGSSFVTRVGSADSRASLLVVGGDAAGACTLTAGGSFNAYLTNLVVGTNDSSIYAVNGLLNLSSVTNGRIDAAGSVAIGIGSNAVGEVRLTAFSATAGQLQVGASNQNVTATRGTLLMTGTVFTVTNSVLVLGPTAANRGRILTTVNGAPAGLDLAAAATLTVHSGIISNVFLNPSNYTAVYWSLRWEGDHTNTLEALRAAGKLMWTTSALNDRAVGPVRIFMDSGITYVGAPMRKFGGSLVILM